MALKTIGAGYSPKLREVLEELQAKVTALATLANESKADHNALLAKLDADTGVNDADYASLYTTAAADVSI